MFSVKFVGFETIEQAEQFALWYNGSGEQGSALWLEEHTDLSFAEGSSSTVTETEVIVNLVLTKKEYGTSLG